jgi:hypothetical protein
MLSVCRRLSSHRFEERRPRMRSNGHREDPARPPRPRSTSPAKGRVLTPIIAIAVASALVAASVGVLYYVGIIPRGGPGGPGAGGGGPRNPNGTAPPPTSPVTGFLIYQPEGTNYSGSVSQTVASIGMRPAVSAPYGEVEAKDGTVYRVLLGSLFSSANPLALQGNFTLVASAVAGYYDVSKFVAGAIRSTPALGSEVNLSATTVGVAAANLTLGWSVDPTAPFAYLSFGTYPTFFSNVSMQGIDLNASTLSLVLNVNTGWFLNALRGIDPNIPSSLPQIVVVNHSINLPSAGRVTGQLQVVVTPSNVSAFLSAVSSSEGSADIGMITSAMNALNEELLGLSVVSVGQVTFYFVLGPTELTRASLRGLVTLDVESSALSTTLQPGTNPAISGSGSPVTPILGVTWDTAPVASSGYARTTVRGLWGVATESAVTVQAAAIGVSLSDAGAALQGMGYSEGGMVSDIATMQNAAVFVLVDPGLIQDPNLTGAYQAFALAIVPNDELALQHSIGLYLTLNGVSYNTSHYLGSCSSSLKPGCPILVADTIGFGTPATYSLDQLGQLTSPTFVKTNGFLAGTTMQTVGQSMGGYDELIKQSPVDVGVYDLGYSNGRAGYNLPSVYLTWGRGPTLEVTSNYTEGLYVPVSAITAGWYLDNFGSYLGAPNSGVGSGLVQALQSDTKSIQQFIYGSVLNGSLPVPGVLIMMDLWANTSAGQVMTSVSGGGSAGCISLILASLGNCVISNLSVSANAANYVFPAAAEVSTSFSGSATGANLTTASCVWWGRLVPSACSIYLMACLPGALCSLSPYHVTNVTLYTCYEDVSVYGIVSCSDPFVSLGSSGSVTVSYNLYWDWVSIESTNSFSVPL